MDSRHEDSELEVSQTTTQMQRMFELTPAVSVAAVAVAVVVAVAGGCLV